MDSLMQMPRYEDYRDSGVEWLGTIPTNWQLKRLKYIVIIIKRIAGKEGFKVLSITQNGIKVKDIESGEGQLAMDYSKYQLLHKGEYAMNHMDLLTGYVDISSFDGVVSPDYRVFLNFSADLNNRYLLLLFQIGYQQKIFFRYGQGVSMLGRWRFPADNFNNFLIPIPSIDEQNSITAFLDRKTAQIEQVVAIKEKQIALLKERKQILIQNAVTRGLDPNVPMKDSGVEWIGEIPEHWIVKRLKYVLAERNERSKTGGEPLFMVSQVFGLVVRSEYHAKAEVAQSNVDNKIVYKDDLVFNKLKAHLGVFFKSNINFLGLVSPDYAVYKPKKFIRNLKYLEYLFRHPAYIGQFIIRATGIVEGLIRLYTDELFDIPVAIPPDEEQIKILEFISVGTEKIDKAIDLQGEQIDKLKEYKATLINSAVTGKIKVL
jgi:type I restriction enzyme S subunit